jgi:CDP-diacylglycerol--glycerol-3-phosphate 3-phosphatidyltransferase
LLKHIPNALTLIRLALAPVIAWLAWVGGDIRGFGELLPQSSYDLRNTSYALAAILFVVAALTDLFDGMIARAFNAHSKFGRLIDPIADKALVGLPLIAIVLAEWGARFPTGSSLSAMTIAVAVIVARDVTMTIVRLSAPDGEGARVSSLAKIKTALELFVVGAFLVGAAVEPHFMTSPTRTEDDAISRFFLINNVELIWTALLVITAALSAYTGWQYLRPAKKS